MTEKLRGLILKVKGKKDLEKLENAILEGNEINMCNNILGKGEFGTVIEVNMKQKLEVDVWDGKVIEIPAVYKIGKAVPDSIYATSEKGGVIIIRGIAGIVPEVVILSYLGKAKYRDSPHFPCLLAFDSCNHQTEIVLASRKYGDKESRYDLEKTISNYWGETPDHASTSFNDMENFIPYLVAQDFTFKGKKLDPVETIDFFFAQFLHTQYLFIEGYGILINDIKADNIFLEVYDDASYYRGMSLRDAKRFLYKVKENNYLAFDNPGIGIVLGDLGTVYIKVNDKLYISGFEGEEPLDGETIKEKFKYPFPAYYDYIYTMFDSKVPFKYITKSSIFEVMNSEHVSDLPTITQSFTEKQLKVLPSAHKLLEHPSFDKYRVATVRDGDIVIGLSEKNPKKKPTK